MGLAFPVPGPDGATLERLRDASEKASALPIKAKVFCFLATALLWGGLMAWQANANYGIFGMRAGKAAFAARGLALPGQGNEGSLAMGVFVGERRVGELRQHWKREDMVLTVNARLAISVDAFVGRFPAGCGSAAADALDIIVDSRTTLFGQHLEAILATARIGNGEPDLASIFGTRNGDKVEFSIRHGDHSEKAEFHLPPQNDIDLACFPLVALPRLQTGMTWPVATLDPFALRVKHSVARVMGRERHPELDSGHVFVVRIGEGGTGSTLWVAEDGRILRKTVMGLTFVREEARPPLLAVAGKEGAR